MQPTSPALEIVTNLPFLPARPADSNKGQFGRILVVAGSRGMTGAAILCGRAALRGGAGLVKVAVPRDVLAIVAAGDPCYMTVPLIQDVEGRLDFTALAEIFALEQTQDAMAVGPGLGRSTEIARMLPELIGKATKPIVLDADGLNAFDGQPEKLHTAGVPLIITPHPGELGRLLGVDAPAVQANRADLACRFAHDHKAIVVLKGHGTLVTDGRQLYSNPTGNPGMATGGTGDVLTGLIAALVGQGLEPFAAALLGVYLHGRAGDLARDALGEIGMIATDLLDFLPRAIRQFQTEP